MRYNFIIMLGKGIESLLPKKAEGIPRAGSSAGGAPVFSSSDSLAHSLPPSSVIQSPAHPAGGVREDTARTPLPHHRIDARNSYENDGTKKRYDAIFHIEVEKIVPNPYQPRRVFEEEALEELAASIREFGVLQPLVVVKRVEEVPGGAAVCYELIAGERRLMAAKRAGLERVPAIVRQADSHAEKLEVALIENLQRRDLSSLETARAYARLQEEFGLTQREIGARVGKSREAVANTLRLLQLPPDALQALSEGTITETQARTLLAGGTVVGRGRSVPHSPSPEDAATVRALEEKLSTPVKVVRAKKGGKIEIAFYSEEEYAGLRARLLGEEW